MGRGVQAGHAEVGGPAPEGQAIVVGADGSAEVWTVALVTTAGGGGEMEGWRDEWREGNYMTRVSGMKREERKRERISEREEKKEIICILNVKY